MRKSGEGETAKREVVGWAATDSSGILSPFSFCTRVAGEKDVTFKVLYCGICHTDLHYINNDWGNASYPLVPGHEVVGVVLEVGCKVDKFKVGDRLGVGCIVGSCHSCNNCRQNLENYCPHIISTYGSTYYDGTKTQGGYSDIMVVDQYFAVRIPHTMPLHATAPLLCAGITAYSAFNYFHLHTPGLRLGVVGLGGIGHLAVKFGKAFGAKLTVISTSPNKRDEAIHHLGADSFILSSHPDQMKAAMGTMDGIIDTVSAPHAIQPLLDLLKSRGKLVLVGLPEKALELPVFPLVVEGKIVAGSSIGGMKETQEMIDFAAKHGIRSDIEVVAMDYVNTAMERLQKSDVRYRFVIDVGNTLNTAL